MRAAVGVGIPARAAERHVLRALSSECGVAELRSVAVTVVGDEWFGAVEPSLAAQAKRLARAAGVDLLEVRFSGGELGSHFVSANLWPDLSPPRVADSVLEYLRSGSRVHPPLAP